MRAALARDRDGKWPATVPRVQRRMTVAKFIVRPYMPGGWDGNASNDGDREYFDSWEALTEAVPDEDRLMHEWAVLEEQDYGEPVWFADVSNREAMVEERAQAIAQALTEAATEPRRIIVEVQGGLVQEVRDVPIGVIVEVRDYDTDGIEEEMIEHREGEDDFVLSEWGPATDSVCPYCLNAADQGHAWDCERPQ